MGGGHAYPGLPVANPTVSYWQLPPHRIAEHRTTAELPTNKIWDYVIVGSGISGAATAHKLLSSDPNLNILMLEARTAASGASGRNGGHCRAGYWLNFPQYVTSFGEVEALKCERLEEQNVADVADFVRQHNVDCDFRDVTTVDAFLTQKAWNDVLGRVKFRDDVHRRHPESAPPTPRIVLEGETARKTLGMAHIVGAVTYPAHTQNPYQLVCHMLQLSLDQGMNLQTNTPVFAMESAPDDEKSGARWILKTDRGSVCSNTVVLATNGFTNALYPELAETKFLTPGRSQVTALRPGSNMSNNPALKNSAGLDDMGSGDYFMVRAPGQSGEGDLIYGGGRSVSKTRELGIIDDAHINPDIAAYLHQAPIDFFGDEAWGDKGEVIRDWSGITCYTPDTFPLVGEAPSKKGLWLSVGMNGHGMALAFRSAEALVQMMTLGREPDWFPAPFRLSRAWKP